MSEPTLRYGELYDGVGMNGKPFFRRARFAVNDPEERRKLVECLRNSGSDVFASMEQEADVMKDLDEAKMLSIVYATDGEYVWRRELAYYVERYGVAPDDDFYAHIRGHDYQLAEVEVADQLTDSVYELMDSRF